MLYNLNVSIVAEFAKCLSAYVTTYVWTWEFRSHGRDRTKTNKSGRYAVFNMFTTSWFPFSRGYYKLLGAQ